MAIEAPTNCWTLQEARIALALSHSAAFQSLGGYASQADAAANIFGEQLNEPLNREAYTPAEQAGTGQAIGQVYSSPEAPYGRRRLRTSGFQPYGTAVVWIERLVGSVRYEDALVPQELEREFKNRVGDVMDQLVSWIDANGGPHIREIVVESGPGWTPRESWESEGAFQGVSLLVQWGLE